MPRIDGKSLNIAAYVVLIFISIIWIELNELPLWVVCVTAIPLIIADIFGDYNPKLLAYIYTHRRKFSFFVMTISLLAAGLAYLRYPLHKIYFHLPGKGKIIIITQFITQGAIAGLTLRILLLNLFADMLRAKDIHKAKLLIMLAWVVFLIMFPVNGRHRSLSSVYVFGFGVGFLLHYYIRVQERINAQRNRLKENILAMVPVIKARKNNNLNENKNFEQDEKMAELSSIEEEAVRLYSNQKWKELKRLLNKEEETTILFFIKLCMHRKLHQFETAIGLIIEKIDQPNLSHKNYYHLHYALNQSELFNHKSEWKNREKIFFHLEQAYELTPDCLLTCATYALRVAEEIKLGDYNDFEKSSLALRLIWKAMKVNEGKPFREIVGLATGMTIPVTYTFLLDTYGYVLLKSGRPRFAKAIILQSLFQDPSFSATYLHLSECYLSSHINSEFLHKRFSETWKKSAQLNLYIAIEIEKEYDSTGEGTFISHKATRLLQEIK